MAGKWEGIRNQPEVIKNSDSKKDPSQIVREVEAAILDSGVLERASELKAMIDAPTKHIHGGRPWTLWEQITLGKANNDFVEIKSKEKSTFENLNSMHSLFKDKRTNSDLLSKNARQIEQYQKEIDEKLASYEEKLSGSSDQDDNTNFPKKEWEEKAREQVIKLQTEKSELDLLLAETSLLQEEVNEAEKNTANDLESLFGENPPSLPPVPIPGPQSADAINQEMREIKEKVSQWDEQIGKIFSSASDIFGKLFESIGNLVARITDRLKTTAGLLNESQSLLDAYPGPALRNHH